MIKKIINTNVALIAVLFLTACGTQCEKASDSTPPPPPKDTVEKLLYLTKPDQSVLFAKQDDAVLKGVVEGIPTIEVKSDITYQEMDGFGYTLTGGSALHLYNMSAEARAKILNELFATDGNNIGISFLRIGIGATDLDEFVFSYNDLKAGETDFELEKFTIDQDRKYLIPILKEILAINSNIKIIAVPWSPPTWMKTNGESIGGELKEECYDVYAQYFIKYIQEMEQESINIHAMTIQNEPLHPGNNPSMHMSWQQQAAFIKNSLGPAFEQANITTKVFLYDHNADHIEYPINIMEDPEVKKYVAGSAFHLYGGSINDLSKVHQAHPDKDLYFTEQWTGANGEFGGDLGWHLSNIIIGGARNWCKAIFEWNLAANSELKPYTPGGCTECLGALTIDGDVVKKNVAYYILAHAAKFVRPGAVRVESDQVSGLENVAFITLDDKVVLIIQNQNEKEQSFNVKIGDISYNTKLPAKGVGTIVL